MLPIFFKYFTTIFCSFYLCNKILLIPKHQIRYTIFSFLIAIAISFSVISLIDYNSIIRIIFMYILSSVFIIFVSGTKTKISLITAIISYGFTFTAYMLSNTILSIIYLMIFKTHSAIPYSQTDIPAGILQFIFIVLLFRIKRLQKGINLLVKTNNLIIGTIISILLVTYIAFSSLNSNIVLSKRNVIIFSLLSFSIAFLFYWRHRITQTYKEKLRLANEKSLEQELKSKEDIITALQADNERLSKIVHKDNKLIPAMEFAVSDLLQKASILSPTELNELGQNMSAQLHNMAQERQGILLRREAVHHDLHKSGLHAVDGMLTFMETRCGEQNITYKVQMEEHIKDLINAGINEADLLHLLGDLIENAIVATQHSTSNKIIEIRFGSLQNHFLLEIADSGTEFAIDTYMHFGNEQFTTHKEDGGSGIGLMDIWKIKKKYKASIQIYEYPPANSIYTKKICFVFDRKNHFLLQTYRHKEIMYSLTRGDIYVFPYTTE